MRNVVISVDPGVTTCGWCYWSWRSFQKGRLKRPLSAGFDELSRQDVKNFPRHTLAKALVNAIIDDSLHKGWHIKKIVCEEPRVFSGIVGHAAAMKGDVTAMAFFCGAIAATAWTVGAEYVPAPVIEWKGNMSKNVVAHRIDKRFKGETSFLSRNMKHDWDACGVGLWAQGLF